MQLKEYLDQFTENASYREIARELGMNPTTLTKHLQKTPADPMTLIAVARHYNIPVLQALVQAGILSSGEASAAVVKPLAEYSDKAFLEEILRRVEANPRSLLNRPSHLAAVPVRDNSIAEPLPYAAYHGETELPPDSEFEA